MSKPRQLSDQIATTINSEPGQLDPNGFLRIKARVARVGVQYYKPEEVGDRLSIPRDMYALYRSEAELFDPESMASLEGLPVTADLHIWQVPEAEAGKKRRIGSVSGVPMRDGDYLMANLLIDDADAIERIRGRKLVEISAAYGHDLEDRAGTYSGEDFDGVVRTIRYNHLTLLPEGQGRAGPEVRVMDKDKGKKEGPNMPEMITVNTPVGEISVEQGSKGALIQLMDQGRQSSDECKRLTDEMAGLETKMAEIEALNAQIAEKQQELDTLMSEKESMAGELEAVKAELDEALGPQRVAEAAEELASTREVAEETLGMDRLPEGFKSMSVPDIKRLVAQTFMADKGRSVDKADEWSADYVEGIWSTVASTRTKEKEKGTKRVPGSSALFDSQKRGSDKRMAMIGGWGTKKPGQK